MSADQITTDPAATGTSPDGAGQSTPRTFTQDEVSRLVAREVGKLKAQMEPLAREREELTQRLTALDEERKAAEEAKLSATQRAELQAKKERETWEKKVSDLTALSQRERQRRHGDEPERHAHDVVRLWQFDHKLASPPGRGTARPLRPVAVLTLICVS